MGACRRREAEPKRLKLIEHGRYGRHNPGVFGIDEQAERAGEPKTKTTSGPPSQAVIEDDRSARIFKSKRQHLRFTGTQVRDKR